MSTLARIERFAGAGVLIAALGGTVVVAGLVGCTSVIYDSNPEGPASQLEEEPDFASHTVQNLLATSVRWAVEQYPPPGDDGWFAVNLPRGLTREQYIGVSQRIGERAAPMTPDVGYLPTYHVGWVWMRGDHARVDVFRPVYMLTTGEEPVYQAITLHMRRRYASWRVERTQPWEPGVVNLPPLYYLPLEEVPAGQETPVEEAPGMATPAPEEPGENAGQDPAEDEQAGDDPSGI